MVMISSSIDDLLEEMMMKKVVDIINCSFLIPSSCSVNGEICLSFLLAFRNTFLVSRVFAYELGFDFL